MIRFASIKRGLTRSVEMIRRKQGYDSESSDDDDLEDVPSASRSRRQGGRGARAPPTAKRRDIDMEVDEDDDDPCRAKKRTFFSSKGSRRSNLPKVLVNGSADGGLGNLNLGKGILDWSIGLKGDTNGNGSVSRAASPLSVAG